MKTRMWLRRHILSSVKKPWTAKYEQTAMNILFLFPTGCFNMILMENDNNEYLL